MIQRIQTLFLLAASGLLISLLFIPMIRFTDGVIMRYIEYYPTAILSIVSVVISIVTIFKFKTRMLQIRLCNLNSLILIGFQIYISVLFFTREESMVFSISAVFPICAAILTFIAMRYIAHDEAMVLASSRLRRRKK